MALYSFPALACISIGYLTVGIGVSRVASQFEDLKVTRQPLKGVILTVWTATWPAILIYLLISLNLADTRLTKLRYHLKREIEAQQRSKQKRHPGELILRAIYRSRITVQDFSELAGMEWFYQENVLQAFLVGEQDITADIATHLEITQISSEKWLQMQEEFSNAKAEAGS